LKKGQVKLKLSRIRIKFFAAVCAILILLFILIFTFSSPALFRAFSYRTYAQLNEVGAAVNACSPGSITYLFDLNSIAVNNNVDFEIVNSEKIVSYSSISTDVQSGESLNPQSEYSSMLETDEYKHYIDRDSFEIRQKPATNTYYYILHYPLSTGETLYIYSEVADVENIVYVAGQVFTFISTLILILFTLVFYLLIAKLTKPLVEMNDITKDMAALNFERKCKNYGSDEIGELGTSINTLSDTLDATLLDLKDKNEQLEKDIERQQALDNARKSFIDNVSHELKTPIAIISGYAEGVCEGISNDPDVIKEYCHIINDESKKMNTLVLELLELSKLENRVQPFMPEYFDLGELVSSLLSHLALQFEQNSITVKNHLPESLKCYAQIEKIEIVLKNYITNAISHCSGDKVIEISLNDKENCHEICVFNTGENIKEADMKELWDSFFRADKSHARSENRFGLGLSIVKSIMTNHKCKYGVRNVENGVVFSFEVPKDADYYEENQK